ncbi:RICIN domain-containing protein [Phormidium sp. FACHB-1136]|uniref:RICIN domain-containing protein n=1 Tax=Phormidium sp. FACHB-1136 TaxID=2692848 RepID=UPI00168A3401|nr:RICIN domain-containing protein [Phormidium sp. FACHB-1136]MBD2426342.1 RICIN domain-containing protein [Phormidium sp. FACHB-1136]
MREFAPPRTANFGGGRSVVFRLEQPTETDKSGFVVVKQYDIYLHGTKNVDMWYRDKNAQGQLWVIKDAPFAEYYTIQNKESGLFLDGSGGRVSVWHWTGLPQQYWKIKHVGGGECSLQCKLTDQFLVGSLKGVSQWHWEGKWHHRWAIIDEEVIRHWEKEIKFT